MRELARWTLVLATLAMLLVLLLLNWRLNNLQWQVHLARLDQKELKQVDLRQAKLRREVAKAWDEQLAVRDQLFKLLADCTSRDDFVVREGPWIVADELRQLQSRTKRVGMYVPAGGHVLKFAVERSDGSQPASTIERFFQHDSRLLSGVVALSLPDTPQVFELQLEVALLDAKSDLKLTLIGEENVILAQHSVRLPTGAGSMHRHGPSLLPRLNYPSEIDVELPQWNRSDHLERPITELLQVNIVGVLDQTLSLRVWIESTAPSCLSSLKRAYYRGRTSSLYNSTYPLTVSQFDDLLEPYIAADYHP